MAKDEAMGKQGISFDSPVIHYQNIVDPLFKTPVFYEALARFSDGGNVVMPDRFLDEVRLSGKMPILTSAVIREVCDGLKREHSRTPVSVNVPFSCLTDAFSRDLLMTIMRCGLKHESVIIEITEDKDGWDERAVSIAWALSRVGVQFILDDYIGCHWQERALIEFPFSGVKMHHMILRASTGSIKDFFRNLKERFDTKVNMIVMEGVETAEDQFRTMDVRAFCSGNGIRLYAQGFRFGRPDAKKQGYCFTGKEHVC